ncbi:MAG: hypothetical protein ACTSPD_16975 [Promethearchaeota archaeon]
MRKKYRHYREIERLHNEIEMLEYHRKKSKYKNERKRELDGMIDAQKQGLKKALSKNI